MNAVLMLRKIQRAIVRHLLFLSCLEKTCYADAVKVYLFQLILSNAFFVWLIFM